MIFKNRRNEFEIIQQLLSLSLQGTKKTRLMYQTNICHSQFVLYLNFLLEKKFLETHNGSANGSNTYKITEKGQQFLQSIDSVLLKAK